VSHTLETRGKGRLLAYSKISAMFERKKDIEDCNENVMVFDNKEFRVVGIYSGFKTYQNETVVGDFERAIRVLEKASSSTNKKLIIGGDFNPSPLRSDKKAGILKLWSASEGLVQKVKDVTRYRLVGDTIQQSQIDLVYTNDPSQVTVSLMDTEVSDHKIVIASAKTDTIEVINQKKILTDWRHFSDESFQASLRKFCTEIRDSDNVDILNREIICSMTQAMNEVAPQRVVHLRRESDLYSVQVSSLQKKRDRLLKKARKHGTPEAMERVREINKEMKRVVKKERKRVIGKKIEGSSAQGFWQTVNHLLGCSDKSCEYPIKQNDQLIDNDMVPKLFSEFFIGKVEKLIQQSPVQDVPVMKSSMKIKPFSHE